LYDLDLKSSKSYNLPIICVGNLSVGGTGKTPMIEYLIRQLSENYTIATLSRGYKRSTKGFVIADETADAISVGDEPFQFYKKFKNVIVSVDENRQHGIQNLLQLKKMPKIILLDDAYQHRKVKAGFNILLTTYSDLYVDDMLLPTGNLREPISGANRANIIVVTKCPIDISETEKQAIISKLKPLKEQQVFFSSILYSETLTNNNKTITLEALKEKTFTLVTGIENSKPLVDYFNALHLKFHHLRFDDHHEFTATEIKLLKEKDLIITTEKDFVRLESNFEGLNTLFYLPIKIEINNAKEFNIEIEEFIASYSTDA